MKKVNNEPLSPLLFLERSHKVYKNKIAIIDKNIRKTYQEFYDDCVCLANSFKKIGARKGDKIAYLSRNNYQMLEAHYGVPMFGGVLVPINIRLKESDVGYILKHSEAKIFVVEEDLFHENYLEIMDESNIIIISKEKHRINNRLIHDYSTFVEFGKSETTFIEPQDFDESFTITINYTSGTSGTPKGVMYSHRGTYLNSIGECLEVGLTNKSNYLWVLPMFHCNGWCFTWAVTAVGGTHVCLDSFDVEHIINLIIENNITHFCAAPTVLIMLLEAKNFSLLKNRNNLKIITAGSAPSPRLIEAYEESKISLVHVYGLTETHGPHSICEEQDYWKEVSRTKLSNLKSSQGVAGIHSVFMTVVDKNMNEVPHDGISIGEVVMKGNNVMKGYYKDPQGTQKAFEGGWFHSGDAAVIKPDGYIEIKDRLKYIIISGGENIPTIKIENVLYEHPYISFVAVIPMHDEKWGEVPHAVIELKRGCSLTENEVILHCKNKLAHYMCPKVVTFRTLPKTSTGKIQKYILKKEYYYSSSTQSRLTQIGLTKALNKDKPFNFTSKSLFCENLLDKEEK